MNTDLSKRTVLPAYIRYQDILNADDTFYKANLAFYQKANLASIIFTDKFKFNTKDGIAIIKNIWNDEDPESDMPDVKILVQLVDNETTSRLVHLKDVDFKLISHNKKNPFDFVVELAE